MHEQEILQNSYSSRLSCWTSTLEAGPEEERESQMIGLFSHFRFHHKSISTITRPEIVSTFLFHNNKRIIHDNSIRCKWNVKNLRSCSSDSALQMQNEEGGGGGGGDVSMVQGASRGIGLEFVRQLLDNYENGRVIATCRNPDCAEGLLDLKRKHTDRLTLIHLDVTDESSISVAAKSITKTHGRLDLLVNTSGILCVPTILKPETTLSKVEKSSLLLSFEVNAVGPILVIKHMCPLLRNGGGKDTGRAAAIVVNLSARVGSIGDNRLGGWHSYRSSKAALNQLTKNISLEFERRKDPIICLLLHPGTVDTDLSKPFQHNILPNKLFTKEFSVQKLLGIINGAKKCDNGKFIAWDGQEIPW